MPQAHLARTPPSGRVCHRSRLQGSPYAPHPVMPAHTTPATPASRPVLHRGARRTRGHMERLAEHRRRLPHARHERGQGPDACRNQHKDLHARTQLPDRTHDAGQDTKTASRGLPGLLRPSPQPRVALPKPSTAASNTYAAPPSDSETSPTTSPDHSSKQEDSDPNYTLNYEEPV